MILEKTMDSGAILEIHQLASFSKGTKLVKVIFSELKSVGVELGDLKGINFEHLGKTDVSKLPDGLVNTLKNALCQIMSSEALEAAFFECAANCLYNGQKITRASFEPEEARGDYFPVAWEVITKNVAPFFKALGLSFLTKKNPTPSAQP